jgi:D-cysteine desulfhydrase
VTALPERLPLAMLPTPLEPADRLSEAWEGPRIWVKRDDLTGFGVSGNKIRKLEFHFAAARAAGAGTVITCGALQSNHCRATALAAARTGFEVLLLLRTPDGQAPQRLEANHLLQRLAGARVRFITPDEWQHRSELMSGEAGRIETGSGRRAWIIPEGASDGLGMWSFVLAMQELEDQLVLLDGACAGVWHAASSGGTTAGLGWGADRLGSATPVMASSVGESAADLSGIVARIWREAAAEFGGAIPTPQLEVIDRYVGEGYGRATSQELAVQAQATGLTGLLFDPTYSGKAIYGLYREIAAGRFTPDDQVVFWHTGGGFALFSSEFDFDLGSG